MQHPRNAIEIMEKGSGKDPVRILIDAADEAGEAIGVEFAKASRAQIRQYLEGQNLLELDPDDPDAKDVVMDLVSEFVFESKALYDKVDEVLQDLQPTLHGACVGPAVEAAIDLIREAQGLAQEVERTRDLGPVIRFR